MDMQEANDARKIVSATRKVDKLIDNGFSEEAKELVTQSALFGGIALALPIFGLDNILYLIALWSMYIRICSLAKKKFSDNLSKSFIGAIVVNWIIATILELIVSWIPVAGWIVAFLIGYISIKLSGAAYLKALEILHDGKVSERYTFNR